MKDAVSVVKQYDYSGKCCENSAASSRTAGGFGGKKDKTLYYSLLITQRQNNLFDPNGKSAVYESQS
jgi:hypothetical protein